LKSVTISTIKIFASTTYLASVQMTYSQIPRLILGLVKNAMMIISKSSI